MASITGFNSSTAGAFSEGEPLSAAKLNRLAAGIELAKTQFSDGLLYQGGPSGVPYTVQTQNALTLSTPEQFQVALNGSDLYVAKGRVIMRSSPNSFTGGCLKEFLVNAFAVVPTLSFTAGTETDSPWVDDNGYVTIKSPLEEGHSAYGVYIILNQYVVAGSTLPAGTPYLAVMPVDGDAETKTRPWGGEGDRCDNMVWKTLVEQTAVTVETPGPPPYYEPTTMSGYLPLGQKYDKLYNYNCQRVKIASIDWDSDKLIWVLTQHLVGNITLPYQISYSETVSYDPYGGGSPPSWYSTPYYDTQQTDWEGAWTDCQKWDGTGPNPTLTLNL